MEQSKTKIAMLSFFLIPPAWVTKCCCKSIILHLQNYLKMLKVYRRELYVNTIAASQEAKYVFTSSFSPSNVGLFVFFFKEWWINSCSGRVCGFLFTVTVTVDPQHYHDTQRVYIILSSNTAPEQHTLYIKCGTFEIPRAGKTPL